MSPTLLFTAPSLCRLGTKLTHSHKILLPVPSFHLMLEHRLRARLSTDIPTNTQAVPKEQLSKLPLSESFPPAALPHIHTPSDAKALDKETRITKLSNGLRVASENRPGLSCTIGLAIDSGTRYEAGHPLGVCQMLDKLAFRSTSQFSEKTEMLLALERHGGICDAQMTRDMFIFAASCSLAGVPTAVNVLAEAALRPLFREQEMRLARQLIEAEWEDMSTKPDQEMQLQELVHAAAYMRNTLGLARYSHPEQVQQIKRTDLYRYLDEQHTPERMVLGGVGIEHERLVELAEQIINKKTPIWKEMSLPPRNPPKPSGSPSHAQYTGGFLKIDRNLKDLMVGPAAGSLPETAHVMLAFASCSHQVHEDFVPLCVLQSMMGGGGSFSAGGPGKGMYTRLYLRVLNQHHWVQNATAHNFSYSDTGLFTIHGGSTPDRLSDLIRTLIRELVRMRERPTNEELRRAKTQLQSLLLMNLEQRPVILEDLCRQVLSSGTRRQPTFWFDLIEKVTAEDVQRIAGKILSSRPTLAAIGNLQRLPSMADVQKMLASELERAMGGSRGRQTAQIRRFTTLFTPKNWGTENEENPPSTKN